MPQRQKKKGKPTNGNARKEGNSQPFERPSLEDKGEKNIAFLCPLFTACCLVLL